MTMPTLAEPVQRDVSRARLIAAGITPSQVCSPCVLGKQICGTIQNCEGGRICGPCIPFINKKLCVPGGLVSC